MSDLSILCVSRGEPHAVRCVQHLQHVAQLLDAQLVLLRDGVDVHSAGYVESMLDQAVATCERSYVLRIDDDEACSRGLADWLQRKEYEAAPHWKFPRAHLWADPQHMLVTPHLWPDYQTRLSWKQYAGGRQYVHAGSPHGGGIPAPYALEHHKFLVRSLAARRQLVQHYDAVQPGAGTSFRAFSCPEDYYTQAELAAATWAWDGLAPVRVAA